MAASSPSPEPPINIQEASGSYVWEVQDKSQVNDFLNAPNGKRLKSLPFAIGKLQWLLEAFPNGDRADNKGSFMVYLTLAALPNEWKRVTFLLRLYNKETCSSFTGIATYTKTSNSGGWSDGTLLLNDLKNCIKHNKNGYLTLGCKINILQLVSIKSNILYEYPLKLEYINQMKSDKPIFEMEWVIGHDLLNKFREANVGKKFESDIFYDSWSLRAAPNGKREDDKNNVKLYLLLCALPPKIVHIKVKYTLSCDESNSEWTNIRDFSYLYPNVGWPNGTLSTHDLKTKYKHYNKMTFRAKIEILKLYDAETILSSDEEDDDDSDSSSSSYPSSSVDDSKNENQETRDNKQNNDNINGSNMDIKKRKKSSNAKKKSEIRRKKSNATPSPKPYKLSNDKIPKIKAKNIRTRGRQETDVVAIQEFVSRMNPNNNNNNNNNNNLVTHSANSSRASSRVGSPYPGFQMRTRQITDIALLQKYMTATVPYQPAPRNRSNSRTDDTNVNNASADIPASSGYDQRLSELENKFKTLSSSLQAISLTLKNIQMDSNVFDEHKYNHNNGNNELFKLMREMRRDITLIKQKIVDTKYVDENQEKLKNWLNKKVGLPEYFDIFIENGLDDLDIIKDLNEMELISIGITKLGHKKKLLKQIELLQKD